jgi:hypothetical protein
MIPDFVINEGEMGHFLSPEVPKWIIIIQMRPTTGVGSGPWWDQWNIFFSKVFFSPLNTDNKHTDIPAV